MIQEYLALGIFIAALILAAYSLFRFIMTQIKGNTESACSGQCSCKTGNEKKLKSKPLSIANNDFILPERK
jgi:hypothetical protein